MTHYLSAFALVLVSGLALPAFAEDTMDATKMTCADFEKLDAAGMATAMDAMHKAGPDAAMMMDDAAKKAANDHVMMMCKGHDDMLAMDAMMAK